MIFLNELTITEDKVFLTKSQSLPVGNECKYYINVDNSKIQVELSKNDYEKLRFQLIEYQKKRV